MIAERLPQEEIFLRQYFSAIRKFSVNSKMPCAASDGTLSTFYENPFRFVKISASETFSLSGRLRNVCRTFVTWQK